VEMGFAEMTHQTVAGSNVNPPDPAAGEDAWLDEALAASFPASDPVPRRHADAAVPVTLDTKENV
jgi:hypothetical protein